jgi:hypothetical protein
MLVQDTDTCFLERHVQSDTAFREGSSWHKIKLSSNNSQGEPPRLVHVGGVRPQRRTDGIVHSGHLYEVPLDADVRRRSLRDAEVTFFEEKQGCRAEQARLAGYSRCFAIT